MVSKLAETCASFSFQMASLLRIFPGAFDKKNHFFHLSPSQRLSIPPIPRIGIPRINFPIFKHEIIPLLMIIAQLTNDVYFAYFFLYCRYSLIDVVVAAVFGTGISGMAFFVQINYFFASENIVSLINSFWILDKQFCM